MIHYCDGVRREIQLFILLLLTVVVPLSLTIKPHSFLKERVMVTRTQGMGDELDLK